MKIKAPNTSKYILTVICLAITASMFISNKIQYALYALGLAVVNGLVTYYFNDNN